MQLIELGAPLEMLVVPSIGSIAMSNCGVPGSQVPSCSPLKIPGALSLIPSPMTTSPHIFMRSNMPRMASLAAASAASLRSEEHTSELQSHSDLVCRLLLEKKNK